MWYCSHGSVAKAVGAAAARVAKTAALFQGVLTYICVAVEIVATGIKMDQVISFLLGADQEIKYQPINTFSQN